MLFPNTTLVPDAGLEDPFVWRDETNGVFHSVFHSQIEGDDQRLCGGHAFSVDGERWTFTGTAWSNRVRFVGDAAGADKDQMMTGAAAHGGADAFEYRFSRRERPHLLFDKHGSIIALTTGVQYGAHAPTSVKGEDACFTLLQPVRRAR